jgi:hypothetical protein
MILKLACILSFNVLLLNAVLAQTQPVRNIARFDSQLTLTDFNGQPINRNYNGLAGIPFAFDNYQFGEIELKNGRKFSAVKFKIDIVAQEIVFLSPTNEAGGIASDFVKSVSYYDTTDVGIKQYLFKTGLPPIDNYKSNMFCLVLADGKISLLKSMFKSIDTRKNDFTGEILKEFRLYEDFYTFQNGTMTRFKRDKDNILTVMSDKRALMEKYLKENKGNFKNEDYLAKILLYYNNN